MEEKIIDEGKNLKLNYSLKEALMVHKFWVICNLVALVICIYFVSSSAGDEEKSEFLNKFWIPFLAVSIIDLFFNLYYVFSLTRNQKTYLFVALFPMQFLHNVLVFSWFSYLIALVLFTLDITEPHAIFAVVIFSYCILDSIMVFILLSSIFVKAKPVTTFLCKYWFIRDTFLLIVSCILFCFYVYLLISGHTSMIHIIFLVLTFIQVIVLALYMKNRYFKPKTWLEPKSLEAKIPENKMIIDAMLLITAMEEEKIKAAGAA